MRVQGALPALTSSTRRSTFAPALAGALLATALAAGAGDDPHDARAAWLGEHAIVVRSIDPTDEDFSDLMPLITRIGDARIVGLGEQTHGDGATFRAKARLVRFLHQVMGFDVLVWESGFYDCRAVDRGNRRGLSIDEANGRGVFGVWSRSAQVRPLLEYVAATQDTPRPIETAGLDCQLTGGGATLAEIRVHLASLVGRLEGMPADEALLPQIMEDVLAKLERGGSTVTEIEQRRFRAAVDALLARLALPAARARTGEAERIVLDRMLRNLAAWVELAHRSGRARAGDRDERMRAARVRERGMAETLIDLARRVHPDRKLIVWAASSHLTWSSRRVEWQDDDGTWHFDDAPWEPMGNAVKAALGDELYVVDFIAYEGEIGSVAGWSRSLAPAPEGSLDDLCHRTGHAALFVDLRTLPDEPGGAWLRERLVARPRGYAEMRASWPEVCDAMMFTDRMVPSTVAPPDQDDPPRE